MTDQTPNSMNNLRKSGHSYKWEKYILEKDIYSHHVSFPCHQSDFISFINESTSDPWAAYDKHIYFYVVHSKKNNDSPKAIEGGLFYNCPIKTKCEVIGENKPLQLASTNSIDTANDTFRYGKQVLGLGAIAISGLGLLSGGVGSVEAATPVITPDIPQETCYTRKISQIQSEFSSRLIASLRSDPIEDGVYNPGEEIIQEALVEYPQSCLPLLQDIFRDNYSKQPSIAAGILRLLGRMDTNKIEPFGTLLAIAGLQSPHAELRDSAIRMLESLGEKASSRILKSHVEKETHPRLKRYIQQVIIDLQS